MTNSPEKEGLEKAVEAAKAAARLIDPTCNLCGVAYVEDYEGPCQEPLPPHDGSRTCPGTVSIWPDRIAEVAVNAVLSTGELVPRSELLGPTFLRAFQDHVQASRIIDWRASMEVALATTKKGDPS